MEKIKVYNLEGKEVESLSPAENFSSFKWNQNLAHEILTILKNNSRVDKAKVKSKAEVRGGGKKPWKQKGTGRARAGSNRSPIWRGGGITFGPTGNRNFVKKINAVTAKNFFAGSVKKKIDGGELFIVESWEKMEPKTKNFNALIEAIGIKGGKILTVGEQENANLKKASGNFPKTRFKTVANINSLDFYLFKNILIDKKSFEKISDRLKNI